MDRFKAGYGFSIVARSLHEIHFNACFGLKTKLRQLQLRNGFRDEPWCKLVKYG